MPVSAREADPDRRRRLLVLAVCCMSLLIVSLDSTVLNVALPSMRREFHATVAGMQWTIDAYTLVNARVTWQNPDKDLSVALEVTNLTDKYYYLTDFDLRAAGAGLDKAQPGRPREWALTVRKSF